MISIGIDIGSITSKAAIMEDGKLSALDIMPTGYNVENAGKLIFEKILLKANIKSSSIDSVVATGYGRKKVGFAKKAVTEITCHAKGAYYFDKNIRTIIDIGGQDSKVIIIDKNGNVENFLMNDKCAAGTGRFLEVMAKALGTDIENFGKISLTAGKPETISSTCTVFAESEIISLIAEAKKRENIIAGIHKAVSVKIAAMTAHTGVVPVIMMTGGVAKNICVVKAIEEKMNQKIKVTDKAQFTGAIGASIIAAK